MIRFLYPVKIKEAQKVAGTESFFRKKQLQIGLNESDVITFQPNSVIVLDFGKEIRGGIRILTSDAQDKKCARIRIRFGEALSECQSNKEEAAFLKSEKGIEKIVDALYRSVCDYSDYVLGTRGAEAEESAAAETAAGSGSAEGADAAAKETEPTAASTSGAADKPLRYTVQVLASKKSVGQHNAEFKRYRGKVRRYASDGAFRYKYGVGEYATRAEAQQALAEVRELFPKAFVIAVRDGRVVPMP